MKIGMPLPMLKLVNQFQWNIWDPSKDRFTYILLGWVEALNSSKDSSLSYYLHHIADHYDPRPTGQWEYRTDKESEDEDE